MSGGRGHESGSAPKRVKVAVVQASPIILDLEGTLQKVEKIAKEAGCNGGSGAKLVLFPEAFLFWYPRGNTFEVVIGSRHKLHANASNDNVWTWESWLYSMRHIAVEGRCFVLTCNQFVKRSDYKSGHDYHQTFESNDPNHVICSGGSAIIDPYGQLLAGPNFEGEAILYAELDLGEILRAKIDFDPVGHYSRPDVFSRLSRRLFVNQKENKPVTYINQSSSPESKQ